MMRAVLEAGELPVSLAEAKAWLRMGAGHDDAVVAALVRTAASLCEAFTGLTLIRRGCRETITPTGGWQRLTHTPVVAISGAALVAADGTETVLNPSDYAIDIDSHGDGWVRVTASVPAGTRAAVSYLAGIGDAPGSIPEALRQGMLRLTEHLHRSRSESESDAVPPAIVTALWQPWRRMRLGQR